jgi:hypothetical protein
MSPVRDVPSTAASDMAVRRSVLNTTIETVTSPTAPIALERADEGTSTIPLADFYA